MTAVRLLRRLNNVGVSRILEDLEQDTQDGVTIAETLADDSAFVWYAASGGTAETKLDRQVAEKITTIAENHGFPDTSDQTTRAAFDNDVAVYLGSLPDLKSGEALRDDVWAFMSIVLLLKIVEWRFEDLNTERLQGGVRNAFQRLWMRGITLDLGEEHPHRWRLVETLSEDAMVQIFERASIASNARLARAIATNWIETAERIGRGKMERVMRQATKLIRIRNEVIDFTFLDDEELESAVKDAFLQVAALEPIDSREVSA